MTLAALTLLAALTATTATGPTTVTTFSTPGPKTATLKVCNAAGCSSLTKSVLVVDLKPKIVSLTTPAVFGTAESPVSIVPLVTGKPTLSYVWTLSLPDGSTRTATTPSFLLSPTQVGSHTLSLRVANLWGSDTTSRSVAIIPTVFADVPPAYWAASFVETISYSGLTSGCGNDPAGRPLFCPESHVSRAELAVFLISGGGFSPPPPTGLFADVPPTHWAARWIEQAYRAGLIASCSTSGALRFCPSTFATRQDIGVGLMKDVHPPPFLPPAASGIFSDVPISSAGAAWLEQMFRDGVTSGCSFVAGVRRYCPEALVTRAEMSVFLVLALHLQQTPTPTRFLARLCTAASCSYPTTLPIDFDLRLSGGIPTAYDFDWNGDGAFEESAPFPVTHAYSTAGTFTPRLRLRRGAWSAVLVHPFPIKVLAATFSGPAAPTALFAAAAGLVAPTPTDPPGTFTRAAYRVSAASQAGVAGYAVFVNPGGSGSSYRFAGLLSPNRPTATDLLLLPPPKPGAGPRFFYLRSFSSLGAYGPSSLPATLP
jgi:PKD repeat protein